MSVTTRLSRLLLLIAAIALVAACGGAATTAPSATPEPTPTPTTTPTEEPTDTAEPSGDASDVSGAAAALESLQSYQIDVSVSGLMPTASGSSGITMTALFDRENDAVDFTISGFEGLPTADGGIRVILIGDDAWVDFGTGTFIAQAGGASGFEGMVEGVAPSALLTSVPDDAFADLAAVGTEQKNGVATTHYHVDSSVPGFADSLGEDGEADIWIADDGGYLVSMEMTGTVELDGETVDMEVSTDVTRLNDPTIDIQPPS